MQPPISRNSLFSATEGRRSTRSERGALTLKPESPRALGGQIGTVVGIDEDGDLRVIKADSSSTAAPLQQMRDLLKIVVFLH